MTIRYEPEKILKKIASKKNIEKLVTDKLTINRVTLNALNASGVLGKKQLEFVALNVIRNYRDKADVLTEEGLTKKESREEVLENKKQLVQRIQNATTWGITQKIKEKYAGEFYIWLKSTAENPDHKHRRKYGRKFVVGKGEMPGDRYGCQCGMELLVKGRTLNLDED